MPSNFEINEDSDGKYTATLEDENGDPIVLADIETITLTLFLPESTSNTIVNSRNEQNIKNANNVTIHATSGLLTWSIQAGDTAIIDTNRQMVYEIHRALFEFAFGGGKKGKHTMDLYVKNLKQVP